MNKRIGSIGTACVAIGLSLACSTGGAQDLGKLGGMIPGGGGSMTSGSMGNVAGLLQYCMKNNFLGGNSGASGVQSQLMSKLGAGGSGSNSSSNSGGSGTSDMLGQLTGSKQKSTDSSAGTSGGATKPATLASGAVVNVPLFIKEGEWIKVDTTSGQYLERVNR